MSKRVRKRLKGGPRKELQVPTRAGEPLAQVQQIVKALIVRRGEG